MPSTVARPVDPTKPSPVAEQRFWLHEELARALPTATKDEIILLQEQLQAKMVDTVEAALAQVRAAPEETLARLRRGEPVFH